MLGFISSLRNAIIMVPKEQCKRPLLNQDDANQKQRKYRQLHQDDANENGGFLALF